MWGAHFPPTSIFPGVGSARSARSASPCLHMLVYAVLFLRSLSTFTCMPAQSQYLVILSPCASACSLVAVTEAKSSAYASGPTVWSLVLRL
eukprot:1190946-Prorocentrum_minimum.AAC.5